MRGNEIIPLSDQAALIGTDGWACGTGGIEWRTPVRLNDDLLIDELRRQSTHTARYALMLKLARGYAEHLRPTLISALETEIYKELILATQVPPFEGATWHEGQVSGPDYLPLFSSPTMGKMIESEAEKYPKKTIRIYCGHTHSSGFFKTRNIKVWTGGARYSYPEVRGQKSAIFQKPYPPAVGPAPDRRTSLVSGQSYPQKSLSIRARFNEAPAIQALGILPRWWLIPARTLNRLRGYTKKSE